ncbi:MAG: hypothetical protein M1836_006812 [Candelina mexicana]|nr:MAG: hypothetical protein M1836_006812 [Candelina mexicana]
MKLLCSLATLAVSILPLAFANDRIPGSMFRNDPHRVAMAAVPMWHFGRPRGMKPCTPQDAVQSDGSQTNGNDPEPQENIGRGCYDIGDWHGANSQGNPFPTYYTVKKCGDSWRVTYSLYFRHDSGHKSDWEWVSVVWWQDGNTDQWYRGYLLQSYHSGSKAEKWQDIQNTINGDWNKFDQNQKDRNHAKVYVGAYHHAMFTTRKTSNDNAGSTPGDEFRSNDWYFLPWDSTVQDTSRINPNWNWGQAKSSPSNMFDRICNTWECPAAGC